MIRPSLPHSFALGIALAVLSPAPGAAQPAPPGEEREQERRDAEADRAAARARQAWAEGKAELAAAEWRTVLRHREARLKAVRDLLARGRLCTDEALREAEGSAAVARAWLAEAEGRRADLRAELPKVIAYHEWRMRRYRTLLRLNAISKEDAETALKDLEPELRWARGRLAGLGDSPTGRD